MGMFPFTLLPSTLVSFSFSFGFFFQSNVHFFLNKRRFLNIRFRFFLYAYKLLKKLFNKNMRIDLYKLHFLSSHFYSQLNKKFSKKKKKVICPPLFHFPTTLHMRKN